MNLKLTSKLERLRKSKKGIGACVLAARGDGNYNDSSKCICTWVC